MHWFIQSERKNRNDIPVDDRCSNDCELEPSPALFLQECHSFGSGIPPGFQHHIRNARKLLLLLLPPVAPHRLCCDATYSAVPWCEQMKFGSLGAFKLSSRWLGLWTAAAQSSSRSLMWLGAWNFISTSCTSSHLRGSASSRMLVSLRIRSWKRGTPICSAKHCFNAFTEDGTSSSLNVAFSSAVRGEITRSMAAMVQQEKHQTSNSKQQAGSNNCATLSLPEKRCSSIEIGMKNSWRLQGLISVC